MDTKTLQAADAGQVATQKSSPLRMRAGQINPDWSSKKPPPMAHPLVGSSAPKPAVSSARSANPTQRHQHGKPSRHSAPSKMLRTKLPSANLEQQQHLLMTVKTDPRLPDRDLKQPRPAVQARRGGQPPLLSVFKRSKSSDHIMWPVQAANFAAVKDGQSNKSRSMDVTEHRRTSLPNIEMAPVANAPTSSRPQRRHKSLGQVPFSRQYSYPPDNGVTYFSPWDAKALHTRDAKFRRHSHPPPEKGPCPRCMKWAMLSGSTNVIRVGGGYIILDQEGEKWYVKEDVFNTLQASGWDNISQGQLSRIVEENEAGKLVTEDGHKIDPRPASSGNGTHGAKNDDGPDATSDYPNSSRVDGTKSSMQMQEDTNPGNGHAMASSNDLRKLPDSRDHGELETDVSLGDANDGSDRIPPADQNRGAADSGDRSEERDVGNSSNAGDDVRGDAADEREAPPSDDVDRVSKRRNGHHNRNLSWEFNQEVEETLADGTRVLADGTQVRPDGSIVLNDGTVLSDKHGIEMAMKRKLGSFLKPTKKNYDPEAASLYKHEPPPSQKSRRRPLPKLPPSSAQGGERHPATEMEVAAYFPEASGINALDYLAKYCILDPVRLQQYKLVFNNLDMDSDGEITMTELEFGMKTVNKNLITAKEVDYVTVILEVDKARAFNFRMFAVICALSERVVGLDYVVKRLINALDSRALSAKITQCRNLFFLLDDKRRGTVAVDDLVDELRAGRISEEHEQIIVDKFTEGGKQSIDFMDFLTYVPLFIEIHETITDNPLNFTRDK